MQPGSNKRRRDPSLDSEEFKSISIQSSTTSFSSNQSTTTTTFRRQSNANVNMTEAQSNINNNQQQFQQQQQPTNFTSSLGITQNVLNNNGNNNNGSGTGVTPQLRNLHLQVRRKSITPMNSINMRPFSPALQSNSNGNTNNSSILNFQSPIIRDFQSTSSTITNNTKSLNIRTENEQQYLHLQSPLIRINKSNPTLLPTPQQQQKDKTPQLKSATTTIPVVVKKIANVESFCGGGAGYLEGKPNEAKFSNPQGIIFDASGKHLLLADMRNSCIRQIRVSDGHTSLFCGTPGTIGSTDGSATTAQFHSPFRMVLSRKRKVLYVSDYSNCTIRVVSTIDGSVSTLCGTPGHSGHKNGTCKEALFWDPAGLCLSKDENTLFVCDRHNHEIREIDLIKNTVNTICGSAQHKETKDGVGTQAHFVEPHGVVLSQDGKYLIVTDYVANMIRRVNLATREVSTFSGSETNGPDSQFIPHRDGARLNAKFSGPTGICVDKRGTMIICDSTNRCLRKYDPYTESVTTWSGAPRVSGTNNGPIAEATFTHPVAVAIHPKTGKLYCTDWFNNHIRVIHETGLVGDTLDEIALRVLRMARLLLTSNTEPLGPRKRATILVVLMTIGAPFMNYAQLNQILDFAINRKTLKHEQHTRELFVDSIRILGDN